MTDPAEDSSLEPLAVRDFSGPRDFVKAANEEHDRRLEESLPEDESRPSLTVAPWTYQVAGTDYESVEFLGVTVWDSETGPFDVDEALADARDVATNASVWADE